MDERKSGRELLKTSTVGVPKAPWWTWLLWWQIDPTELDRQVTEYDTLRFFQSMRGISLLLTLFSFLLAAAFIYLGVFPLYAIADGSLMLLFGAFVFFGHRWAMIAAMILWTMGKAIAILDYPGGGTIVGQVVFWCIYMHALYFSYRIEQAKRLKASGANNSSTETRKWMDSSLPWKTRLELLPVETSISIGDAVVWKFKDRKDKLYFADIAHHYGTIEEVMKAYRLR
jgi:hypothetical protein